MSVSYNPLACLLFWKTLSLSLSLLLSSFRHDRLLAVTKRLQPVRLTRHLGLSTSSRMFHVRRSEGSLIIATLMKHLRNLGMIAVSTELM